MGFRLSHLGSGHIPFEKLCFKVCNFLIALFWHLVQDVACRNVTFCDHGKRPTRSCGALIGSGF